jgi:ATP-dependent DNA helicase HFM1/MER3
MQKLAELPRYRLEVSQLSAAQSGGKGPVFIVLRVACGLITDAHNKYKAKKGQGYDSSFVLTVTSDLDFVDFRRVPYVDLYDGVVFF